MSVDARRRPDSSGDAGSAPSIAPRHSLASDPREVTHVVCCRDDPWVAALCGFDISKASLNLAGDPCAMCLQVVESRWSARGEQVRDEHCPTDGSACPSDEWIFSRVVRETT